MQQFKEDNDLTRLDFQKLILRIEDSVSAFKKLSFLNKSFQNTHEKWNIWERNSQMRQATDKLLGGTDKSSKFRGWKSDRMI